SPNSTTSPSTPLFRSEVGYNYRLSNLLAAFGRGQLATLDERITRRRAIQARYREAFTDLAGVAFPAVDARGDTNAWLTCITLERSEEHTSELQSPDHL